MNPYDCWLHVFTWLHSHFSPAICSPSILAFLIPILWTSHWNEIGWLRPILTDIRQNSSGCSSSPRRLVRSPQLTVLAVHTIIIYDSFPLDARQLVNAQNSAGGQLGLLKLASATLPLKTTWWPFNQECQIYPDLSFLYLLHRVCVYIYIYIYIWASPPATYPPPMVSLPPPPGPGTSPATRGRGHKPYVLYTHFIYSLYTTYTQSLSTLRTFYIPSIFYVHSIYALYTFYIHSIYVL